MDAEELKRNIDKAVVDVGIVAMIQVGIKEANTYIDGVLNVINSAGADSNIDVINDHYRDLLEISNKLKIINREITLKYDIKLGEDEKE